MSHLLCGHWTVILLRILSCTLSGINIIAIGEHSNLPINKLIVGGYYNLNRRCTCKCIQGPAWCGGPRVNFQLKEIPTPSEVSSACSATTHGIEYYGLLYWNAVYSRESSWATCSFLVVIEWPVLDDERLYFWPEYHCSSILIEWTVLKGSRRNSRGQ